MSEVTLLQLPYQCQFKIFGGLDIQTLSETRQTSKFCRLLSDSDQVWLSHAKDHFDAESLPEAKPAKGYRNYFFSRVKCWSSSLSTDGMTLINGNTRVVRSSDSITNWGTAVVDYPRITDKKQYCEFLIESCLPGYLEGTPKVVVGVIPTGFSTASGKSIGESQSYGYQAQNGKKVGGGGADHQDYAVGFGEGDRIGVLADPEADQIVFFKNGVSLGVAFSNFKEAGVKHYNFAVSVVRSHFQVRILGDSRVPHSEYSKTTSVNKEIVPSAFPFDQCPSDIKLVVLNKLTMNELDQARLVCHEWKDLAGSNYLWAPIANKFIVDAESLLSSTLNSYRLVYHNSIRRFSSAIQAPGLELSNGGCTVTSTSQVNYWSAIRLEHPKMNTGVHYAEFQIDTYRHGSIGNTWKVVCGVVSEEFEYSLTKWVGVDEKSFGYIAANGKAVGPLCKNLGGTYSETYQENDRIGILVDFEKDEIIFYKNGINLGVAFTGFSKQAKLNDPANANYYFAVSMARWGMRITSLPGAVCPDRHLDDQPIRD